MRHVGFFVCPRHGLLDLAGALGAFEAVGRVADPSAYRLDVLSRDGGNVVSSSGVPVGTAPALGAAPDTLIIVGGDIAPMLEPADVRAVADLAAGASRLASVCTGAFLLAETGLMDGRRATTHWRAAQRFQHRYPAVKVESDRIFVDDGPVWSSAGITAGVDLALALIEKDLGRDVARQVARELVVYHRRSGGQSQFAPMSQMEPASDRIRIALAFARDHLHEPLPIERLADAAHLSVRQFGRAFHRDTGETPARAVERLRAEAARMRLQDGSEPVERIASETGFLDPERMRRAFLKLYGLPPQAIRRVSRREAAARPGPHGL